MSVPSVFTVTVIEPFVTLTVPSAVTTLSGLVKVVSSAVSALSVAFVIVTVPPTNFELLESVATLKLLPAA